MRTQKRFPAIKTENANLHSHTYFSLRQEILQVLTGMKIMTFD